jgi:putative transposase
MKAYPLELRQRIIRFILSGGSKVDAARIFNLCEATVYRYIIASKLNSLAPKKSWGSWKKLDPDKLKRHMQTHPDATLKELQAVFNVSHNAIWVRLNQLGLTLKKTHKISRKKRGSAMAIPEGTRKIRPQ